MFGFTNVTRLVGFNNSSFSSRTIENHFRIHACDFSNLRIGQLKVQDTELDPALAAIAEHVGFSFS